MRPLGALVRTGALGAVAGLGVAVLNHRALPRPPVPVPPTAEDVVVCVPARDEAGRVGDLVADLRVQAGVAGLRVLVLDDGSADATTAVARAVAGDDPRVVVHRGDGRLAPGWLGKPAACHRLAQEAAAGPVPPTVLVFCDADVRLAPDAVAAGVALLRSRGLALVCPWPRQVAGSPLERLVQPLQQWSWFTTLPLPAAARSLRPSTVAVCGQLLVVDAAAYHRAGGHAAVAGEVVEDLALARAVRRAGGRTAPAAGATLARCRMYDGAAALREGYGKSLWTLLGPPPLAAAVLLATVVVHVVPPAAAVLGRGRTRGWGLLGASAALAARLVSASACGDRAWPDALAHPVGVLGLVGLTLDSHRRHRSGALRWKGRALPR